MKKILLSLHLIFSIYSAELQNDNFMTQEEKEYLASLDQQIDAEINKVRDELLHEVIEKTEQDIEKYEKCQKEYESALIAWADNSNVKAPKPICNCKRKNMRVRINRETSNISDWNKNKLNQNKIVIYKVFSNFSECIKNGKYFCIDILEEGSPLPDGFGEYTPLEKKVVYLKDSLENLLNQRRNLLEKIALRRKLHQQAAKVDQHNPRDKTISKS